jgi:hypothetical protein
MITRSYKNLIGRAKNGGLVTHERFKKNKESEICLAVMQSNTLTTIDRLRAGDIFCKLSDSTIFVKIDLPPVRKRRHLYRCHAIPVNCVMPVAFKENTEVVFLK